MKLHAGQTAFHDIKYCIFHDQACMWCEHLPSDSTASKGTFLLWGMWPPLMPGRGSGAFAWKRGAPLASTTTSCCCSTLCSICCRSRTCPTCTRHRAFPRGSYRESIRGCTQCRQVNFYRGQMGSSAGITQETLSVIQQSVLQRATMGLPVSQ